MLVVRKNTTNSFDLTAKAISLRETMNYIANRTALISSSTERDLWTIYLSAILLSSIVGDTLILIAARKPGTFKLSKTILVIMKYIAVLNLVRSTLVIFPKIVSIQKDRWVWGTPFGYFYWISDLCTFQASNSLLVLLAVSKVVVLKVLRLRAHWTVRRCHKACCGLFLFSLSLSGLIGLAQRPKTLDFSPIHYALRSQYPITNSVYNLTAYIIPMIILIICTALLGHCLLKSRASSLRAGSRFRWRGAVTVATTGLMHLVVTLSVVVMYVVVAVKCWGTTARCHEVVVENSRILRGISMSAHLNITCNFVVYCITMGSFRRFVVMRMVRCCYCDAGDDLSVSDDDQISPSNQQAKSSKGAPVKSAEIFLNQVSVHTEKKCDNTPVATINTPVATVIGVNTSVATIKTSSTSVRSRCLSNTSLEIKDAPIIS